VGATLLAASTAADVGDVVAVIMPQPGSIGNFCSVGLAFDGTQLYFDRCGDPLIYRISPADGSNLGSFNPGVAGNPNAMAFDAKRNGLWIGAQSCNGQGMPIYFYDFDTASGALQFTIPFGLINPATGQTFLGFCFDDGLAYNENDPGSDADDELYFSDDVNRNIGLFRPDGTLVAGFDAADIDPSLSSQSGLAVGGSNLYMGNNGGGDVFRAALPAFSFVDQFVSEDERQEDMECDPVTFAPIEVMWVRTTPQGGAFPDVITAFEIEPGTCGLGGGNPDCFELGFDTDDEGMAMPHGARVDDEFDGGANFPVTITSSTGTAAILESDAGPATQDPDLLVGCGNILILQNDSNLSECPPASGVYCTHNDEEDGGTLSFAFASLVSMNSIVLIDIDASDPASSVVLTDANGNTRTYVVPANWTGDLISDATSGKGTLLLSTLDPQPGFGSVATASEDMDFDPAMVVQLDVHLGGSGAVDDVSWCTPAMPLAHALTRNGSGANRMELTAVSMPRLGATFGVSLGCPGFAGGLAGLAISRRPAAGTFSLAGEVLIAGAVLHAENRVIAGPSTLLTWDIPHVLSLCGLEVYAQGMCSGLAASPVAKARRFRIELSNALDLTLGY
jgi:hypothetical protein